jgi:hypothetical protein
MLSSMIQSETNLFELTVQMIQHQFLLLSGSIVTAVEGKVGI